MKNQKMKETLRQISKKAGALVLATAIVLGGGTYVYNQQNPVPELVTYVDEDGVVQIQEDETPLASPKVTKSTKTTKSTKKISLKSASSKTYAQKGKTTTKKKTATTKSAKETVTSVTNNYKKGSKINTQVTTVKTTVTKTTVTNTATPTTAKPTTTVTNGTVAVTQIAPAADKRVLNAFQKLGFQVVIKSDVPYSGLCDARTRTLTLKQADATVYHELGHFLAFVAGNVDTSSAFQQIFQNEKSKYTAYDKGYVLQNSAEYFAQSFRDYTENPAALKASRPQTYAAIQQALSRVTDAQVANLLRVYGAVWGK